MHAYEFIEDHELAVEVFGEWPSFHDAEVCKLVMSVTGNRAADPVIELVIHGWKMTTEVTESGHYKLLNPSLIHFVFEGVADVAIDGLMHQNVIYGLELAIVQDGSRATLRVDLDHCVGLSGGFTAKRAKIISVEPHPTRVP